MTFIDRSIPNGDRDLEDDEELLEEVPVVNEETKTTLPKPPKYKSLVVKTVAKNKQKGMIISLVGIEIPRAFDFDYYQNKAEEAKFKGDTDLAIKLMAFKKYAEVVYEFYRQVLYYFNKKHNIIEMPEYIKNSGKVPCDLKQLANLMSSREQNLLKAYNDKDNKLIQSISRSKHMQELRDFAAQAWLMYFSITELNDFVGYLKYIQDCYNYADLDNPSHIANIYGLHTQAKYYEDAHIENFFLSSNRGLFARKRPVSARIYQDIDSKKNFGLLLRDAKAYNIAEHKDVPELKNKIEQDTVEKRIIGFYDHYKDIKYVKHKLLKIKKMSEQEREVNLFLFEDEFAEGNKRNRDLFKVGAKYYLACKSLLTQISVKSKIYSDIVDLYEELGEVLSDLEDCHNQREQEMKKYDERVSNITMNN